MWFLSASGIDRPHFQSCSRHPFQSWMLTLSFPKCLCSRPRCRLAGENKNPEFKQLWNGGSGGHPRSNQLWHRIWWTYPYLLKFFFRGVDSHENTLVVLEFEPILIYSSFFSMELTAMKTPFWCLSLNNNDNYLRIKHHNTTFTELYWTVTDPPLIRHWTVVFYQLIRTSLYLKVYIFLLKNTDSRISW